MSGDLEDSSIVEVKSSGRCFLRAHRSCVPEAATVVPCHLAELGSVIRVTQVVLVLKA